MMFAMSETSPGRAAAPPGTSDSIARSNAHAALLLEVGARFHPEEASFLGVAGVDDRVIDLGPGRAERLIAATETASASASASAEPSGTAARCTVASVSEKPTSPEMVLASTAAVGRPPTRGCRISTRLVSTTGNTARMPLPVGPR